MRPQGLGSSPPTPHQLLTCILASLASSMRDANLGPSQNQRGGSCMVAATRKPQAEHLEHVSCVCVWPGLTRRKLCKNTTGDEAAARITTPGTSPQPRSPFLPVPRRGDSGEEKSGGCCAKVHPEFRFPASVPVGAVSLPLTHSLTLK